jgi:hypothetical protein
MADNPVQHLAVLVTPGAVTGVSTDGLNADYPVGYANAWTAAPETDPSTNNLSNRNMLVVGGSLVPRVLRTGGSGRPQFRDNSVVSGVAQKIGTLFGNSAGSTRSLSFVSQPAAGDLLVAVAMTEAQVGEAVPADESVELTSVTNNAGTSFTQAGPYARFTDDTVADALHPGGVDPNAFALSIWYRVSDGSADDQTVKVTVPTAAAGKGTAILADLDLMEYPTPIAAVPFDASDSTTHPAEHASATLAGGSVTPSVQALVISAFATRGPYQILKAAGWGGVFRWEGTDGFGNDPPPLPLPGRFLVVHKLFATAGVALASNHTHDSSGSTPYAAPYCGLTVALKRV